LTPRNKAIFDLASQSQDQTFQSQLRSGTARLTPSQVAANKRPKKPKQPLLETTTTSEGLDNIEGLIKMAEHSMPSSKSSKAPSFEGKSKQLNEFLLGFEACAKLAKLDAAEKCEHLVRYCSKKAKKTN
jgi:hypothetical protein